jgi:tetratricopeptide (TPR) repeat protein
MENSVISPLRSIILGSLMLVGLTACSLDRLVNVEEPEGEVQVELDAVRSREGGIGLYYTALGRLQSALSTNSLGIGLLTDELTVRPGNADILTEIDARIERADRFWRPYQPLQSYRDLHSARINAAQARSILKVLQDSSVRHVIAGAYAIEAYSVLLLAENLCSGIPLSSVPFAGDIQLHAGVSTAEVFRTAIALFDSALAIPHDSARFVTLARVGKGRAYLGLGHLDSAAKAVEEVQTDHAFVVTYTNNTPPGGTAASSVAFWTTTTSQPYTRVEVVNFEGGNGLMWYQQTGAQDPRVPIQREVIGGVPVVRQQKFVGGQLTFPLARGVEALLIRAEYYLSQNDPRWLDEVNAARQTVGLPDTTDPGSDAQRIDLLFRERAHWFYLEGVRLSDYRRLVRQYQRNFSAVYPSGPYTRTSGTVPFYGNAMVFGPPDSEYELNYLYDGCQHMNP